MELVEEYTRVIKIEEGYPYAKTLYLPTGEIDAVVDCHFRNHESITNVKLDIVTGFVKDFILPIDFEMDTHDPSPTEGCGENCSRKKALEEIAKAAKA